MTFPLEQGSKQFSFSIFIWSHFKDYGADGNMRIIAGKEEIINYSYKCDICGKTSSHRATCSICGRDICYDCTKFDPRDTWDYPEKYCNSCFNIGQKYFHLINIEQERFDALIEKIEQEWKDEAIRLTKESKKDK